MLVVSLALAAIAVTVVVVVVVLVGVVVLALEDEKQGGGRRWEKEPEFINGSSCASVSRPCTSTRAGEAV